MMRRWLFILHLWMGALAGGFFVVLGITGCILALELPLDHVLNARLSYIFPASRNLPLGDVLRSVQVSFPSDSIVAVTFGKSPDLAWQVALTSGIAYVNPYTGQVLGLRSRGQTILGIARRLHVNLASGSIGRSTIQWSNLATLLLLTSGLVLWWQDRRIQWPRFNGTRRFWFELHKMIGVSFFALFLIASGSGVFISFEAPLSRVIRAVGGEPITSAHPVPSSHVLEPQPGRSTTFTDPDRALSISEDTLPNNIPSRMQMPAFGGTYKVAMTAQHFLTADDERVVTIDPHSGKVLVVSSANDSPLVQRFFAANEAVHTGAIFGVMGRTLMALAAIMVLPQAVTGFMMWWKRLMIKTPHKRKSSPKRVSV